MAQTPNVTRFFDDFQRRLPPPSRGAFRKARELFSQGRLQVLDLDDPDVVTFEARGATVTFRIADVVHVRPRDGVAYCAAQGPR